MRKKIIQVITFLGGIYFVLEFISPAWLVESTGLDKAHDQITYGFIAVGAMAFGLGIINLFMVHGARIIYLRKDWFFSAVLLSGLIGMSIVSGLEWYYSSKVAEAIDEAAVLGNFAADIQMQVEGKEHKGTLVVEKRLPFLRTELEKMQRKVQAELEKDENHPDESEAVRQSLAAMKSLTENNQLTTATTLQAVSRSVKALGVKHGQLLRVRFSQSSVAKLNTLLVDGLFNALGAAMFSLLSVYIAAAAYRAFRIRSWESSLMMMAAVIVILGQTPFGLWIWDQLPAVRQWLMEVPNSAAFRAIKIGSGVAGLVMAIRMWLSIESESFS